MLAFAVLAFDYALLTHGTGELFAHGTLSGTYDSLAASLLRGSSEVDPDAIRWEAFVVDGRSYTYFGLFPALLRLPAALTAPSLHGQWSRVSCFLAACLALWAFARLVADRLEANEALDTSQRRGWLAFALAGFGFGLPTAQLLSVASLYHEPILWGFAWSLAGLHLTLSILSSPERSHARLAGLCAAAGAALSTLR